MPLAAEDEPLDPAAGSGRLDQKVQALPVTVPPPASGADEGGREGLVGMAAPGFAPSGRILPHIIHHPIIYEMTRDTTRHPDSRGRPEICIK